MSQSPIRKAIRNLIANPKIFNSKSAAFNPFERTQDLYPTYKHLFNADAKFYLGRKAYQMVEQYNEKNGPSTLYDVTELLAKLGLKEAQDNPFDGNYIRKYALVTCFGFRCDYVDADDATKKLVTIINDMASSKWIWSSLYNIGRVDLNGNDGLPNGECMIISYLAIPSDYEKDVKSTYGWVQFPEGGVPPRFK